MTSEGKSYFLEIDQGQYVFQEGEEGRDMFIIQEGQVEILKRVQGDERQLAVLVPGEFFGEMSILEDLPRIASARALTACRLLPIDETVFDDLLAERPEIAAKMLRNLSSRLREFYESSAPGSKPVGHETLVHVDSGKTFALSSDLETTVGRADELTGHVPGIDLSEFDEWRTVSRLHAKLVRQENRLYVVEGAPTTNGTTVDGVQVATGELVRLQDGVEIQFGAVKTRLVTS